MLILLKSAFLIKCLCVCVPQSHSLCPSTLLTGRGQRDAQGRGWFLIVLMRDTAFNCHYFQFYLDFDMLGRKRGLFLKREVLSLCNFKRRNMLKKSNVYEKQTKNPNLCFYSDGGLPKVSLHARQVLCHWTIPQSRKGLWMSLLKVLVLDRLTDNVF